MTVTRVAENEFRIISGTAFVASDLGWMRLHQPDDGSVAIEDVTDRLGCLGLWGPQRARGAASRERRPTCPTPLSLT